MGRYTFILLFVVLTSLIATDVFARSGRENQIPNNIWGCEVCHTAAGGLNDFGFDSFDYTNGGTVNWNGLSQEDSDRDGYSNGLELEGPSVTHPGDRNDGLCGNGSMEGAEECEAGDLGGATCQSMGLVGGNLTCSNCRFDTSSCDSCGDDMIAGSEECDGTDLGGNTCESLGRGTGTLACNGCAYDYSGCSDNSNPTPATCGNGIRQVDEDCDGSDLGGQTCATLGFTGGVLGCAVRCGFDTSGCLGGSGETSTPGTTGQTNTGNPTPGATPGADTGSGLEAGDDNKIALEGHACTTSRGPAPSSSIWLLLAALAFWRRRITR